MTDWISRPMSRRRASEGQSMSRGIQLTGSRGRSRGIAGIVASCIGLAMLVSGCSDTALVRDGIGVNLDTADLPEASRLQEMYVGEICRQAGLRVAVQGENLYCEEV